MYKVGDKIELRNGSIVEISEITQTIDGANVYRAGNVPIPEDNIVRKIN